MTREQTSKGQDVLTRTEVLQPEPALSFARLLDVEPPDLHKGGLPLLWHWFYLLERPRQVDLGADGHPVRGTIPTPPEPGRRRMFAGGRVSSVGPLMVGRPATRQTEVVSSIDKRGRSGGLTFVVVRHIIIQDGDVKVIDEQDIVYRDAPAPGSHPPVRANAPAPSPHTNWSVPVDPTLLFRFSALTYNAHRIHYDRDYALTEGYPGLVTHGPLQALAMAESVRRSGAVAWHIDYRLVSPLLEHQGLVVSQAVCDLRHEVAVSDSSGRVTARGEVKVGERR